MPRNEKLVATIMTMNSAINELERVVTEFRKVRDQMLTEMETDPERLIGTEEAMRSIMAQCEGTVGDGHACTYDGDDRDQT